MSTRSQSGSATWAWVLAFAREMEAKLARNHKDDREGWIQIPARDLVAHLQMEVAELSFALTMLERSPEGPHREVCARRVVQECADIGNFSMMIADVAGGLKAKS